LNGDRIVEIGAVELINRLPGGRVADAVELHGLTAELLADKPLFGAVADELLAFVGDARLVAHNASFDIAFLNAELRRADKPLIAIERVVDTLVLARPKHPGGHNTLDDLCSRYGVNSLGSKHGNLLDAELLAAVYGELTTTLQTALQLEAIARAPSSIQAIVRTRPRPMPPSVTAEDRNAHGVFVETLGTEAVCLDYLGSAAIRTAA
jgi:DNA polymerase-3 subunit epsilon